MDARPYTSLLREACLRLLRERAPEREAAFAEYLDSSPASFVVLEHDGAVLACGGLARGEELVWGMVDRAWERRGVGRYLLLWRTKQCTAPALDVVTPPEFAAFYEKAGFRQVGMEAAGVRLRKKMAVCA